MKKHKVSPFTKIAQEAGFIFWGNEKWKPEGAIIDWGSDYDEELQKFGELVVRRCIDICEKGSETQTTSAGAALLIKQHFNLK